MTIGFTLILCLHDESFRHCVVFCFGDSEYKITDTVSSVNLVYVLFQH